MAEEERKRPFAVEQANREVQQAQDRLDRAKESGSQTAIDAAQKSYDEAVEAREGLRGETRDDRREARREFMRDYYDELGPYVAQLAKEDPALRQLIQDAIANGWDAQTFERELKRSDWWRDEEKTQRWLDAFRLEFGDAPGGEWDEQLQTARETINTVARRVYNLNLSDDQLDRLARRYIYEGWADNPRDLQVFLANRVERGGPDTGVVTGGTIESNRRDLRSMAQDLGLTYDDAWFDRQALNILNPETDVTMDTLVNDMIREAETLYPVFAGRLSKDFTVRDAAGSYIGQLSNLLEVDPGSVTLDDPLLKKAFGSAMSSDGTPQLMSLWDFQREVRKDDRWQYTANAQNTYLDIGTGLARTMGFLG